MRVSTTVGLAALLAACNGGNLYNQNPPDTADTGIEDTDTAVDTGDTDDTQPSTACHPADPLELDAGWTRTYNVTWEGESGTEVQTGIGEDLTSGGQTAYVIQSELTAGTSTNLTTTDYRGCDNGKAVWYESISNGQTMMEVVPGFPMEMPVHTEKYPGTPEPYLSDMATLEGTGSWSYSYTMEQVSTGGTDLMDFSSMFTCEQDTATGTQTCQIPVEGTVTAYGIEPVTVNGVEYPEALKIADARIVKWSEAGSSGSGGTGDFTEILETLLESFGMPNLFGGSDDTEIIAQKWYVEGIGLVKEVTYEMNAEGEAGDTPLRTRELTSHTIPQQ